LGEHTDHVLREILKYSDDEIAELLIQGVITTEDDLPELGSY
jgi:crotonobetainyl-CoA:carnitine CoA-transferase CaiB-like acyl-CoA transferase